MEQEALDNFLIAKGTALDKIIQTGYATLFSNVTLVSLLLASLTKNSRPYPKTSKTFKDSYDYIIVGGGSAGSVMANRLSQHPCVSVLLLEAGGKAPLLTDVPALSNLFYNTKIDWRYMTEPQKYGSFAQRENRVVWNSGRVLGGGSTLNAMLYVRGNRRNYDQWEAEGATGWSYKDVFPYFLKLEDNRNIHELDPGYHSVGGPLTAEKINYAPEIKPSVLEATADLGFELRDINGARQTGVYDLQGTVRNQQRCSTAKAYLVPAEDRPNLDIVPHAFVRKILIKGKRAIGVEFDYKHRRRVVRAKREVIVSNGSVRTPQLLMLSGIGPREELRKFNISVVADLPGVGQNLMDHYASPVLYQLNDLVPPLFGKVTPGNLLDYLLNRRGLLCAPQQCSVMAFLDGLNTTAYSRDFPMQQVYFAEYSTLMALIGYNVKDEIYKEVFVPYDSKPLYICISQLLQPKSRGYITLRSTNPHDYPKIQPNYYQHPKDLKNVVEAMKICEAVAAHPAMQKFEARILDTMYPSCQRFRGDENKFLTCVALQITITIWHPTGTARMGQPDDPRSVVDPQLRVIGVKGLRVVNAAVMPIIPSGNTNVPTIMIAEKAYDIIKDDIQCAARHHHH